MSSNMQPTRPTRAVRPRQDENIVPTAARATMPGKAAAAAAAAAKETAGVKGEARRRAFGEISNVTKQVTGTTKTSGLTEKASKIVLKEKDQIALKNALAKPAQRGTLRSTATTTAASHATTATTTTTTSATVAAAQARASMPAPTRRIVRKTEVYADRRPSPPKPAAVKATSAKRVTKSPKARTGHIIQRETKKLTLSHIQDDQAVSQVRDEETDEDATDVEGEENAETMSEEEPFDEEEEFTTARSKTRGDNTTGFTVSVILPKCTSNDQKELTEAGKDFQEVDEDDSWDITMVAEYGEEIFQYMRELEVKFSPNANYMDTQPEIQWSMRAILIDWIVQVHNRFGLLPETLFLTCNYIDRFLSTKVVSINKLQLVGATALFVAAKYEEIQCPSVHEIVFMVDNGYSVEEILAAERFMLSMLQFELGWPGPMSFLRRVSKADDYDLETRTLAKYFLELTLMDERFVGTPPSFLAAGAHFLARLSLGKGKWTPGHTHFSGYTTNQLRPLVKTIHECCQEPTKHHKAIFEKYQDKRRYKCASLYVQKVIRSRNVLVGAFE